MLRAQPGEVGVWLIDLDRLAPHLAEGEFALSAEERERAARLVDGRRRAAYAAGRAALRTILGAYLGTAPESLEFVTGRWGKPALAGGGAGIGFNLAHAGDLAVCAVADGGPVGIDVEVLRPVPNALAIARRFFAASEAAALARLAPDRRAQAFLRAWTRKEALVKAEGASAARELAAIELAIDPAAAPRLLAWHGRARAGLPWALRDLELPSPYLGALALRGSVASLTTREFPPDALGRPDALVSEAADATEEP